MNPNMLVYVRCKVNGVTEFAEQCEIKYVVAKLAQMVRDKEMTQRDFSSIRLDISKRPIQAETDELSLESFLDASALRLVTELDESQPIDNLEPIITYAELFALSDDPIWTSYRQLKFNPNSFSQDDIATVSENWALKYADTKYKRLI